MKRTTPTISVSDLLTTLSEHVRLRLLRVLERQELSVGEVARVVQMPQSTVSRHLKLLSDATHGGWLSKRAEGPATFYRLVLDDLPPIARSLWVTIRDDLEASPAPELQEDTRRLRSVLHARREDSEAFFGRVGGEWDKVRNDLFGDRFTSRALLALLPPSWTVADLGCGTGNASELLASHVRHVIAVDRSGVMLSAARKRLEGLDNITFVESDLESVSLGEPVDAAVMLLVLHHIEDPVPVLASARSLLKPTGLLTIVDMAEHGRDSYRHTMGHKWLGFSPEQVTSLLYEAGFAGSSVTQLDPEESGRGPGLFTATAWNTD